MVTQEDLSLLDIPFLERHFCKDVSLVSDVLQSYRESYKNTLATMRAAVDAKDPVSLMKACHLLRGSTLNFLQESFVKTLKTIELSAKESGSITVDQKDLDEIESQIKKLISQVELLIKKWNSETDA